MLHLIEDGKIGVIITKDLSRLGRNYIEVGSYTEIYFPKNNVRYIAVNEFFLLSARNIQKLHSQVGLHSRSELVLPFKADVYVPAFMTVVVADP